MIQIKTGIFQEETEVQGFSFVRADIFGKYLPSCDAIESILAKIKDKRNKAKICKFSNELVPILAEKHSIPFYLLNDTIRAIWAKNSRPEDEKNNLNTMFLCIIGEQCELSGWRFDLLVQSMFTVSWFECLVGDFDLDIQKMRKLSGSWLAGMQGNSKALEKYAGLQPEAPSQRMLDYPEYIASKNFSESFDRKIFEIASYDKRMQILIYDQMEIMHRSFEITEESTYKKITIFCTKCQSHFTSNRMPSLKICGSCRNKSRKQKKASRQIDRQGWEVDRIGACKGGCGSPKKQINADGTCWSCYRSNL